MKRRLLATFLSLCLLVGLLPTMALAEEEPIVASVVGNMRDAEDEKTLTTLSVGGILLIEGGIPTGNSVEGVVYEDGSLTLSGASILQPSSFGNEDTALIYADGALNVVLTGQNILNSESSKSKYAIYATETLSIVGPGDMSISNVQIGLFGKNINICNIETLRILCESCGIRTQQGDMNICDSNISIQASDTSWGHGIDTLTSGNCRIQDSSLTVDPAINIQGTLELSEVVLDANAIYCKTNCLISNTSGKVAKYIRVQSLGSLTMQNCEMFIGTNRLECNANLYILNCDLTYGGNSFYAYNTIYISDDSTITLTGESQQLSLEAERLVLNKLEPDLSYLLRISAENNSLETSRRAVFVNNDSDFNDEKLQFYTGTNGNKKYVTGCIAYMNGGSIPNGTEFQNGAYNLYSPEKAGYIFEGWYSDNTLTGEKATETTAGTNYYAKWVGMADMELQYAGTQQITASDNISLSDYKSSDSSVATVDSNGNVTATGVGTATISATGTYNGQQAVFKATVTVTPRVLTYTNADGTAGSGSITYNYAEGHHALSESLTFKWADEPNNEVTLLEGTDINYTYTVNDAEAPDGGTAQTYDYLPMPVGNYDNVKFNLLNENYTFALSDGDTRNYLEIDVNVVAEDSQRAYLASAWPKADQNFVYTGEGVLPVEGTLNAYADNSASSGTVDIGTFTVNIEGLNDTSFHSEVSGISAGTDLSAISDLTLPTEPGTYIITASAANDSYYLYKSLVFTISKATVTVKADDKSVYVGDEMPGWTYTVSGLASGDSLSGTVSLSCEATDTNTAGTYTITPSGGAVPNTEHYNSEIVYQSGTLTVSTRSSGGGGSSSSNVSGSGDNVTITASGGSVTASQMESAVNKADEGATITIKATSSTTVSLPVGGMADAADNDNDVLLDLRYGELTLTARTIAGLTDGVSSSGKIKVSITSQTSSKDETISDLLDKGAAVFDVSVTINDVEVHSFDGTLTLTFTVSNLSKITDPHILHTLTDGTKEYYAPDSISGNTITVKGVRNLSTFAVIPGSEVPEEQTNPFTDVYESDYYYDAVLWAVANGVTNGTSATTFGPNVTVTRAQMVTFLWRAHGSPEATGANPFTDVGTSDYYYDAVLWAVANGVTTGTSATTFSPDAPVTRAQAVTFQWRAAGSPVVSGSSFDDVAADAYYVNAVTWAVANGITNGTGGNNFSPDAAVSRAQAVTFLYREQE